MDRQMLDACTCEELGEAIGQAHALMTIAHASLLELVAAFDAREGWRPDGLSFMEDWLVAGLAVSRATAREWVRIAHALASLPVMAAAYGEGRLCSDAVAAASGYATPETDAAITADALGTPASCLQAEARRRRVARRYHEDRHHQDHGQGRSLRWWCSEEWFHLRGQLPIADGATVAAALERIASAPSEPDPNTGLYRSAAQQHADALVELAATRLGDDDDAERATVVIHVDAAELAAGSGAATLAGGGAVPVALARRLACDGRIEAVAEGEAGTVGIGRASRQVPPWLSRQLRYRDQGCRFPGCGRRRHLQAHHLVHWSEGGETSLRNLAMVCGHHHKLVHEQGWTLVGNPEGGPRGSGSPLTFVRGDGKALVAGPPPLKEIVRDSLESWGLLVPVGPDTS